MDMNDITSKGIEEVIRPKPVGRQVNPHVVPFRKAPEPDYEKMLETVQPKRAQQSVAHS